MLQDSLSSWKEIAAYLKCDESTARRWERRNGMPVHRVGNKGGAVYAYPQEIDAWVRGGGREESDTTAQATPQESPAPAADPFAATSNGGGGTALVGQRSRSQGREPLSGRQVTRFRTYFLPAAIVLLVVAVTLWAKYSASSSRRHHVSAQAASSKDVPDSTSGVSHKPVNGNVDDPGTPGPASPDREEFTA